jgi:exopolyphosphatase/pppGpp-phosphohydrolase
MGDTKLDPQIAEDFARRMFEKYPLEEDREFNKIHATTMLEVVEIIADGKKFDNRLVETACWLHDIGKTIEISNHAQHSIDILEKEGFEINEKLRDCILNHGNNGKPQCLEAKLIQIADKACMINPEFMELFRNSTLKKDSENKNKGLELIRTMLNKAIDLLKEYKNE